MTEQEHEARRERMRKAMERLDRDLAQEESPFRDSVAIPIILGIATPLVILYIIKLLDL